MPARSTYGGYTAWRGIAETRRGADADEIWACLAVGWLPVGGNAGYRAGRRAVRRG